MTRWICALVLASQLVLIAMLRDVTGRSAIAFSFVGAPLLGLAALLAATRWLRRRGGEPRLRER